MYPSIALEQVAHDADTFITEGVNLDHLLWGIYVRFLLLNLFSPFVINIWKEILWYYAYILFVFKPSPTICSIH